MDGGRMQMTFQLEDLQRSIHQFRWSCKTYPYWVGYNLCCDSRFIWFGLWFCLKIILPFKWGFTFGVIGILTNSPVFSKGNCSSRCRSTFSWWPIECSKCSVFDKRQFSTGGQFGLISGWCFFLLRKQTSPILCFFLFEKTLRTVPLRCTWKEMIHHPG